jgi:hypothetical protein
LHDARTFARTAAELEHHLGAITNGPRVLDVRIDPDVRLGGNQRIASLKHFAKGGLDA